MGNMSSVEQTKLNVHSIVLDKLWKLSSLPITTWANWLDG